MEQRYLMQEELFVGQKLYGIKMVFVIFKKKNELINGNEYLKEFSVILKN